MSRKLRHYPAESQQPATLSRNKVTLLAVSPDQDNRQSLESILDADGWTIKGATSIREATRLMKDNPSLIVCDRDLPDGTWKDLYREADRLENPPAVVVVSRNADQCFWAEVLNVGAYDVLLEPFDRSEVKRMVTMAVRHQEQLCVA